MTVIAKPARMATDNTVDLPCPTDQELSAETDFDRTQPAPTVATGSLLDLVVDAIIDADSYRAVAQEAIHLTRRLKITCDRLRGENVRLREIIRQQHGERP
jgi:hypothetical protein